MLSFDMLPAGTQLGRIELATAAGLERYLAVFPAVSGTRFLPPGLVVALVMRGYLAAVPNRPAGNVHAGQRLIWGPPVPVGVDLVATVSCLDKELRKDRRWVRFRILLQSGRTTHLEAINTTIWGA